MACRNFRLSETSFELKQLNVLEMHMGIEKLAHF